MALQKIQIFRQHCYRELNRNAQKGMILFTGSSLMEGFPINELCMTKGCKSIIYNRGIAGLTTDTFLECINDVLLDLQPSRIFINIGSNDIGRDGNWQECLERSYRKILTIAMTQLPEASITLMAYYPVNEDVLRENPLPDGRIVPRTNQKIIVANGIAKRLAQELGLHFINVNNGLTDADGQLKRELTVDGIHMYPAGYEIIFDNMRLYL